MTRLIHAVLMAAILLMTAAPVLLADHDADDQAWRYQTLLECVPVWDPGTPGTQTWDGKSLHGEPDDVRGIFWETWGAPNGETDLLAGIHVRRWQWEYECLHPEPSPEPEIGSVPETHRFVSSSTSDLTECMVWVLKLGPLLPGECWWSLP